MDNYLTFSLTVFMGFFAIMNPIAGIPIFLGLVEGASKKRIQKITKTATLTAFTIVVVFIFLGKFIFEFYGLTISAFKITGGILIFYVGFEMLLSIKSNIKHLANTNSDENVAISPLATPFLSGPGTIVTAMNFTTNTDYLHMVLVILVFGLMCFLTYLAFSLSDLIVKVLGINIITVIEKIMGLIIAIIGTNMVIEGIKISF